MNELTDFDFDMARRDPATDSEAHAYGLENIDNWFDFEEASVPCEEEGQIIIDTAGKQVNLISTVHTGPEQQMVMQLNDQADGALNVLKLFLTMAHCARTHDVAQSTQLDRSTVPTPAFAQAPTNVTSPLTYHEQQLALCTNDSNVSTEKDADFEMEGVQQVQPTTFANSDLLISGEFEPMACSVNQIDTKDEFSTLMSDVELFASEQAIDGDIGNGIQDDKYLPHAPQLLRSSSPTSEMLRNPFDAAQILELDTLLGPKSGATTHHSAPDARSGVVSSSAAELPELSSIYDMELPFTADPVLSQPTQVQRIADSAISFGQGKLSATAASATSPPQQSPTAVRPTLPKQTPQTPASPRDGFVPYERGHNTNSTPGADALKMNMREEQTMDDVQEASPVPFNLGERSSIDSAREMESLCGTDAKAGDARDSLMVSSPTRKRTGSPPPAKRRKIVAGKKLHSAQLVKESNDVALPDEVNEEPLYTPLQAPLLPYRKPATAQLAISEAHEESNSSDLSSADDTVMNDFTMLDASRVESEAVDSDKNMKLPQKKPLRKSGRTNKSAGNSRSSSVAPVSTVEMEKPRMTIKRATNAGPSKLIMELKALGSKDVTPEKPRGGHLLGKRELALLDGQVTSKKKAVSPMRTRAKEAEGAEAEPNAAMAAKRRHEMRNT